MIGNIYLLGFMGSGKSTIGAALAKALNRPFADMDERLVARFEKPIHEVFADEGEAAFRKAESEMLETLSEEGRLVVATGGGIVVDPKNRERMKASGRTVYLKARLDTLGSRLSPEERAERPLWSDPANLEKLFQSRLDLYAKSDMSIAVDELGPDEVVGAITEVLAPEVEVSVRLDGKNCPVYCTLDPENVVLQYKKERRVFLLTDENVAAHHLDRYRAVLNDPVVEIVPPGEEIKSLKGAERIYEAMLSNHIERGDLLVAVGGGVITDLGAFVASTYKRGMPFVLVSTTFLGCVDAAIGGKAAVNLPAAKNVIGCFSTPDAVALDVRSLLTNPDGQIADGLIEAYKTGLVASEDLTEYIEREIDALRRKDLPALAKVTAMCARAKAAVVSEDFREGAGRRILNFGHTYGHAVESWNHYKISHGTGVAVGMIVAAVMSRNRKLISADLTDRIVSTVREIIPQEPAFPPMEEALELMRHDKKIRGGKLVFILLEGVGKPVIVNDAAAVEIRKAVTDSEEIIHG